MLLVPLGLIARMWSDKEDLKGDAVDDVIAWCEWIKAKSPGLGTLYSGCYRMQRSQLALGIAAWIDPRRYRWRLSALAGATFGFALAAAELGPRDLIYPAHPFKVLLVIAVFVSLQTISVMAARGLLADSLGIFRTRRRPAV